MNKVMRVRLSNGETWHIDAEMIARNRAEYYVSRDIERGNTSETERESEIQSEIEFALSDAYEVIDWAKNSMNWSDFKDYAKRVEVSQEFDYEGLWRDSDISITQTAS